MLTTVFVRRPILASVMSIVLVIAGAVAGLNLPINMYPDIAPVQVTVSANYAGADAETVANTVAAPLETEINGADGLMYMRSAASPSGLMTLTAYFELGTDPDTAEVQVQNRVSLALPKLPDSVRSSGVRVQKRSSGFLMLLALYSPDGRYNEQYIGNYANLYVLDALKRVEGANQAEIMGLPDLAMRVWLDPDRLRALDLTAAEVQTAIARQNRQFGAGTLGQAPTAGPVPLTVPLTTEPRFASPEEFERLILRAETEGTRVVRLADVARVEVGTRMSLLRSELNGTPATFIAVYQQPGSNALAVAENVTAMLEEMAPTFPEGIEYAVSFDTTKVVQASIDEVIETLIIAVLLVILVTYLFLQNVRATLVPTAAILVAVVGTFIGMLLLGFSLNLMTLLGLVLAIGIVVDDAIVVVENVERNMQELGLQAKEATVRAMDEVIGPVIATTLVLIAVFVPVAFLGGSTGVLFQQFAVTIAVSVGISSFVALTLTPALCGVLLKPRGEPARPFRIFNAGLDRMTELYGEGVAVVLRRSVLGVVLVGVMFLAIAGLFRILPSSFVPEEDQGILFAAIMLPDGASLDRSETAARAAADLLRAQPAVEYTSALTGYSLLDGQFKTNAATVFVSLKDFDDRSDRALSLDALLADVRPKLMGGLGEAVGIPINPPAVPGLGSQGGFELWVQSRETSDPTVMAEAIQRLIGAAGESPVLTGVTSTFNPSSRQLQVQVDRTRAETLGVPTEAIYDALQTMFGGAYVSQYSQYGRVWNVIVQGDAVFRDDPGDFDRVHVRGRQGDLVPLSAVITTEWRAGPDLVTRFNGFPAARVNGDAAAGYSSGQAIAEMERLAAEVLPDGMTLEWAGLALEEKQAGSTAAVAFAFGLVLVFLILAAQYEKWSLPLAIITSVPFGLFGALMAIWLAGMDNDVYFQIGLITLIGLSAKNAILIVEFAQLKFSEGMAPAAAALEAAKLRLRPILMTSLSFILGTLPLVIASGAGANARHSIGTGVMGGMIAATTLALFFVPLFYVLIMKVSNRGDAAPGGRDVA
ncbi:multidrug efflux RND transporter permease subunit [Wenzhouxiangella sp. XN79A]|uniref:efflux RND transporter permease subunit n=1 Tax=Wenzhouxiangella sp. XN79A TaxID=2724193 RepID=UPI00144A8C6F|nr:multidrug efflux RND transporter permease subunit [Wenzhouxiangella sp. XN79A]NKI34270.1 multidrug efflux RND transporter permease subunit [Wenzhouxiangella sp. XN79A]